MQTALVAGSSSQLTASKEMGTAIIEPKGTEFSLQMNEQEPPERHADC